VQLHSAEAAFAEHMGSLWAEFAKQGQPSSATQWPQWDAKSDIDLVLSLEPRIEAAWRADVCKFWLDGKPDLGELVV